MSCENLLPSVISCFVIICAAAYWYIQNKYSYWTKKNVVCRPTLPIIGSYAKQLTLTSHPNEIIKDVYDRYNKEKLVGGFKGSKPELIIRDPDIIKDILIKDFNYFHDRGMTGAVGLVSQNLFSVNGEKWRVLRQKLTPTFTSSKMRLMFPLIVDCGVELQNYLTTVEKNELDIKETMSKFTTDTIGTCAFGLKMNAIADENSPFRNIGRRIFRASKYIAFIRYMIMLVPRLNFLRKRPKRLVEMENFFLNLVKQIIASRDSTPSRHDFMDLMIELKNKGSLELDKSETLVQTTSKDGVIDITDELITAQAFVFFLAGFETSSTTMSYALYELAMNPEIQQKVRDEIDTVLAKHDNKLTYDALNDMSYLEMVVRETLRKYPPAGALQRYSVSKYTIKQTDTILEKGVNIIIPVYALHHDEKYFPEPEKFSPERFSNGSMKTYHPFSYLPFGDGPRNCIGFRFGKLQTLIGLVTVLSKYKAEPCSRTPTKLEMEPAALVTASKGGIYLQLKPV